MRGAHRRGDALSRKKIVEAAIAILDAGGETALTVRTLAAKLATGSGAIYWHLADKDALLAATAEQVVEWAMRVVGDDLPPRDGIRTIALAMFDAIDEHPWVGAQLVRAPSDTAMLRFSEAIGSRLHELGVSMPGLFNAWSALIHYIIGVAGLNAANARLSPREVGRSAFLASVALRWAELDAEAYPFVRQAGAHLEQHDDREQFVAGVDLILAGL